MIPVHFPVDRLIQGNLKKEATKINIPTLELKSWTKFEGEEDYKNVTEFAKEIRTKKYTNEDKSLAEMEHKILDRG